jgi:hypothetical protein
MATNPYSFYLDVLSKWETSLSLENLFFTLFHFSPQHVVNNSLSEWTAFWDGYPGGYTGTSNAGWNAQKSVIDTLLNTINQSSTENLMGCVFARDASLPGESISAKNTGLEYGGYQAPLTSNGRSAYGKVSISFTETNSSFVDYVIRPWLILTGYYGLVTRPDAVVKCPALDIVYLGKNGVNKRISSRKIARFYGVVPVSINALRNSYQAEGMQTYSVDFAFDQYAIIDPNSSDNPSSTKKTESIQKTQTVKGQETSPTVSIGLSLTAPLRQSTLQNTINKLNVPSPNINDIYPSRTVQYNYSQ